MLSEEEKLQICRSYNLTCPICETQNPFFRLKRDMVRAAKAEGDGHALEYKWGKAGFDSVNPLQFYWGVCRKCRFTGELDDAEFRQAERMIKEFRANLQGEGLRNLLTSIPTGKGIAQALGKRLEDADPLVVVVAQFHLGIYSQCLELNLVPGNLARYYLRLAWLFRDAKKFYPNSDIAQVAAKLQKLRRRFTSELPNHKDYPIEPGLALNEIAALRFCCIYFERNHEILREAKLEGELRLRLLLAEIGYRLYELTDDDEDYKKAAMFFSGTIQQCLSIVSDKSIVGGVVNRAKDMLAKAGERGRELWQLNKSRGGAGGKVEADAEPAIKKKGKKANTAVEPRTVDKPPRVEDGGSHAQGRRSQFRHFVADGEELYRLDGAHFAIFGPMDNNVARQRAADMRRKLSRADLLIEDTQLPMTSSIGVVTVDRILSNSLAEIANKVQEALLKTLYRAKEKGGNTVELHNTTKF